MEEHQDSHALQRTPVTPPALRDVLLDEKVPVALHRSPTSTSTLRDLFAMIFRHRVLASSTFLVIFLGVILVTWLLPKQYEAQVKILVKGERAYPAVTPDANPQPVRERDVTLEDLNSEVELLKSRDLLEKAVLACGLHTLKGNSPLSRLLNAWFPPRSGTAGQDLRIPEAVQELEKTLTVELIAKSKLIEVRYRAPDPHLAAKVLQTLSALYLEKHLSVHRPPGASDFFQQQTQQYQRGLAAAEKELAEFARKKGIVSIEIERDIALRKQSDFEAQLRETQAAEAATEQRIKVLEAQATSTPRRVITQVRTSDNTALLQPLRTTILNLEMKRTELLSKYEPGYRAVQEVDAEIAQAREALAQAEKNSLRDEVTDLDRTRQWLDEELARTRAELATLRARSVEISKVVEKYRESARQINLTETEHQDLVRAAKTAEANYLLYLRKQEEGRISDALDRRGILNVAIAESATVPALPASPRWDLNLMLGFILALLISVGLAFVTDQVDPSFRTPEEVEGYLGVPVLASMPRA